jgi:hypothetical protein
MIIEVIFRHLHWPLFASAWFSPRELGEFSWLDLPQLLGSPRARS